MSRPIGPPASPPGSERETLAAWWTEVLDEARHLQAGSRSGLQVVRFLSDRMDRLIETVHTAAVGEYSRKYATSQSAFAICAAGGYGRRQLQPGSDVDLLFLHPWKMTPFLESVAESILYALWDLGLTVGHAVRTPDECVAIGGQDLTVRTSLLDLRQLTGKRELFEDGRRRIEQELLRPRQREFAQAKLEERRSRRERFGNTTYLLEPNVKEGPGGLRDLQTVYWIARSAFGVEDFAQLHRKGVCNRESAELLDEGLDRLLMIRNWVHFLASGHQDRLTFELQEKIALQLGFRDLPTALSSEQFMRDYYEWTRGIERTVDVVLEQLEDHLAGGGIPNPFRRKQQLGDGFFRYRDRLHGSGAELKRTPHLMLRAFELAQTHRIPVAPELAEALSQHAERLRTASPEEQSRAARVFLRIMTHEGGRFEALSAMNDTGVLRSFMPEFDHLYCRIQHDTYHIYTADVHLLFCLQAFERLRAGAWADPEPELTELAQRLPDPLLTALAVLLHDIGKGYGTDHSVKGAELCKTIGARLGLETRRIDVLQQLVRQHLLMSHTAQRRDLSDPQVIRQFAQELGDTETLDMLLVLTYCDQMGVGPGVWTPWKRALLLQLHEDARRVLEREDIQGLQRSRIRSQKGRIRKRMAGLQDEAVLERFLAEMPPRFFLRHDAEQAAHVIAAYAASLEQGLGMAHFPIPEGGTVVVLSEPDRSGLFAVHAGLFRAAGMSIVEAEGYVLTASSQVINIFVVDPADPLFFDQPDRVAAFEQRIRETLAGQPEPVPSPPSAQAIQPRPRSRRRVRVRVDTKLSQNFTVFEVFGWDRIGLLQDLAFVFHAHACTIGLARIHTEGQRISDVFYVQHAEGGKIEDPEQLAAIREALWAVVDRGDSD